MRWPREDAAGDAVLLPPSRVDGPPLQGAMARREHKGAVLVSLATSRLPDSTTLAWFIIDSLLPPLLLLLLLLLLLPLLLLCSGSASAAPAAAAAAALLLLLRVALAAALAEEILLPSILILLLRPLSLSLPLPTLTTALLPLTNTYDHLGATTELTTTVF